MDKEMEELKRKAKEILERPEHKKPKNNRKPNTVDTVP
jgi:hypothetical protein